MIDCGAPRIDLGGEIALGHPSPGADPREHPAPRRIVYVTTEDDLLAFGAVVALQNPLGALSQELLTVHDLEPPREGDVFLDGCLRGEGQPMNLLPQERVGTLVLR